MGAPTRRHVFGHHSRECGGTRKRPEVPGPREALAADLEKCRSHSLQCDGNMCLFARHAAASGSRPQEFCPVSVQQRVQTAQSKIRVKQILTKLTQKDSFFRLMLLQIKRLIRVFRRGNVRFVLVHFLHLRIKGQKRVS